jgi:diaminopimelate decarboxylase
MSKPIQAQLLHSVAQRYGTPVHVYDAALIRKRIASLKAFDTIRFAQKACSNMHLLRLMREQGVKVDAVSGGEIERALRAGYDGKGDSSGVVYTADILDRATLERVLELDIPVNAGSITMLEQIGQRKPGHRVWLRINPGFGHGHSRKTNTGGDLSKHGIWHEQLDQAIKVIDQYKLDLVGLHMHIGSGADFEHLSQVCDAMVAIVKKVGRPLRAISAGGGLPIPYTADGSHVNVDEYYRLWDSARKNIEEILGSKIHLEIEPGRYLVAESGKMVSEVRAVKSQADNHFVLVDMGFNDLVRPSMYGSWHEISVLDANGQEKKSDIRPWVVAGPLCESGDVFTQEEGGVVVTRDLPTAEVGDYLVFHDTGAYGATMSSNYNSRPYPPEVLVDGNELRLIRRRQTIDELLSLEENI